MRRFLKGDGSMAGTAINRIIGSTDLYDPVHRGESASVNFLTCHDGFTLYDLYSYNTKHNEKNGWNNTDGDNNGNWWISCAVSVNPARERSFSVNPENTRMSFTS